MKLFFEAGTVSAPDESVGFRRMPREADDGYDPLDDEPWSITRVRAKTKPITMEWNEWSAWMSEAPAAEATVPEPSWVDVDLPEHWEE